MSLRNDQSAFVFMVASLINFAYELGYELTFGETIRDDPKSFHSKKLAIDLNLFTDGVYCDATEDHLPLGLYWESIGGTWGGRFKNKDGNHYSYKE